MSLYVVTPSPSDARLSQRVTSDQGRLVSAFVVPPARVTAEDTAPCGADTDGEGDLIPSAVLPSKPVSPKRAIQHVYHVMTITHSSSKRHPNTAPNGPTNPVRTPDPVARNNSQSDIHRKGNPAKQRRKEERNKSDLYNQLQRC